MPVADEHLLAGRGRPAYKGPAGAFALPDFVSFASFVRFVEEQLRARREGDGQPRTAGHSKLGLPLSAMPPDAVPLMVPSLEQRLAARKRPSEKPRMYQRWEDILFLHWSCEPDWIQHLIPPGLTLDLHGGKAWVAVVPFRMRGVRFRGLPPMPGATNFSEINLRTYVHDAQGRPGVWFLSLDTDSRLAAWLGRGLFGLNYFTTKIDYERTGKKVLWHALRRGEQYQEKIGYRIRDDLPEAQPGSLEFFLLERYHYFAVKGGRLHIGQVHHTPYPLAVADVGHWYQGPLVWNGIQQFAKPPDHMAFSPGVKVEIFKAARVAA